MIKYVILLLALQSVLANNNSLINATNQPVTNATNNRVIKASNNSVIPASNKKSKATRFLDLHNSVKKCDRIKCPFVDKPVCVRISFQTIRKRPVYVVALNECEMKFMSCHKGMKATLVSKSYCEHPKKVSMPKKSLVLQNKTNSLLNSRPKRSLMKLDTNFGEPPKKKKVIRQGKKRATKGKKRQLRKGKKGAKIRGGKIGKRTKTNKKLGLRTKPKKGGMKRNSIKRGGLKSKRKRVKYGVRQARWKTNGTDGHDDWNKSGEWKTNGTDGHDDWNKSGEWKTNGTDGHDDWNKSEWKTNGTDGHDDWNKSEWKTNGTDGHDDWKKLSLGAADWKTNGTDGHDDWNDSDFHGTNGTDGHDDWNKSEWKTNGTDGHDNWKSDADGAGALVGAELEEDTVEGDTYNPGSGTGCPESCKFSYHMACAKCSHEVYRTFMSVCHMKMFQCIHPDEKLELVSRRPCMQSAPYLEELPEALDGLHREPNDEDAVLWFYYCRKHDLVGKIAKCTFDKPVGHGEGDDMEPEADSEDEHDDTLKTDVSGEEGDKNQFLDDDDLEQTPPFYEDEAAADSDAGVDGVADYEDSDGDKQGADADR